MKAKIIANEIIFILWEISNKFQICIKSISKILFTNPIHINFFLIYYFLIFETLLCKITLLAFQTFYAFISFLCIKKNSEVLISSENCMIISILQVTEFLFSLLLLQCSSLSSIELSLNWKLLNVIFYK